MGFVTAVRMGATKYHCAIGPYGFDLTREAQCDIVSRYVTGDDGQIGCIASQLAIQIFLLITQVRRSSPKPGTALGTLLLAYGISRSCLEVFRFDLGRNFLFEESWGQLISTSQAISIPMIIIGLRLVLRARRTTSPA